MTSSIKRKRSQQKCDSDSDRNTSATSDGSEEEACDELLGMQCADCQVTSCPMWRRWQRTDRVLCSLCHLKRVKNATQISKQNNQINSRNSSKNSKDLDLLMMNQRTSLRRNKSKKKIAGYLYTDKQAAAGAKYYTKGRRTVFKRKPQKSVEGTSTVMTTKTLYHNGVLLQVGDIVCTSDLEGDTYYAQLRGFLQDEFCTKSCVITWLIPTVKGLKHFEPNFYVPGPAEDKLRPLECFDFVCRPTHQLFRPKLTDSRYSKQQSDLNALVLAAEAVLSEAAATGSADGDGSSNNNTTSVGAAAETNKEDQTETNTGLNIDSSHSGTNIVSATNITDSKKT